MSTHNARSSGRRSRGGRSRRRHEDRRETPVVAAKPPQKLSFWQKIKAFFTGKKTTKSRPASPAQPRPQYQPRNAGTTVTAAPAPSRPVRKPEAVEVTSPKLYVGNLSFDATESDLSELFNGVGAVKNAEIVSHKATEKSKGFGFVVMSTTEEAKRAVDTLHDKEFMGRKLVVSGAKTNDRVA
ncbi:MAG: hypothetical protein EOP84_02205 [Verrucomicrobiaceae bacterium]|nr:MAG: hypothetical protein EOP84_02205 [Verrucomicrobiaceae bacterium]